MVKNTNDYDFFRGLRIDGNQLLIQIMPHPCGAIFICETYSVGEEVFVRAQPVCCREHAVEKMREYSEQDARQFIDECLDKKK